MSIFQRSSSGSPSTIQLAIWRPMPPAPAMPWAQKPGRDEEATDLGLAEDELVVGRERLGAVDHAVDAGVGDRRDAPDGAVHDLLEARPVGREQLAVEVGGTPSSDHGAGSRS